MFTEKSQKAIDAAKPVKSTRKAAKAKLGRHRTRIAGSRAFLRIAGRKEAASLLASASDIQGHDEELRVLDGSRSIGDALGGDPEAKSPGLGMQRHSRGREFLVSQENVSLAVRCLLAEDVSEVDIAVLADHLTIDEFEEWHVSLPTNEKVEKLLREKKTTRPAARPAAVKAPVATPLHVPTEATAVSALPSASKPAATTTTGTTPAAAPPASAPKPAAAATPTGKLPGAAASDAPAPRKVVQRRPSDIVVP